MMIESWSTFPLIRQLAFIGYEIKEAIMLKNQNQHEFAKQAYKKSVELFDLTLACPANQSRLKEVILARKYWIDYFVGINDYNFTDSFWLKYFSEFDRASRFHHN